MAHYLDIRMHLDRVVTWRWKPTTRIAQEINEFAPGAGVDQVRRQLKRMKRGPGLPRYEGRMVGNEYYWRQAECPGEE